MRDRETTWSPFAANSEGRPTQGVEAQGPEQVNACLCLTVTIFLSFHDQTLLWLGRHHHRVTLFFLADRTYQNYPQQLNQEALFQRIQILFQNAREVTENIWRRCRMFGHLEHHFITIHLFTEFLRSQGSSLSNS